MSKQYYVYVSGEVEGPYDGNHLEKLYKSGKIDLQTQVREDGGREWLTYADLKTSGSPPVNTDSLESKPAYQPLAAKTSGGKAEAIEQGAAGQVNVVDFDISFLRMFTLILRYFVASLMAGIVLSPILYWIVKFVVYVYAENNQ